jgi:hypothetical protein
MPNSSLPNANKDRPKRDGYDQANIILLFLTFLAASAAAIGVFYQANIFSLQLTEMQKAYGPIKDSAIAATNSANTARDALLKAQRPFVYQKSVWYRAFIKDGKKLWRGIVEWENSGLTPTKIANFELVCPHLDIGKGIIADPYALKIIPNSVNNTIRVSAILAPKQTKFGGQCEFAADELLNAQNGTSTQYIIGQVTYTDIFDVTHITRYCEYIYHIGGDVAGFGNIEVSGNSCVRHNCADEECEKEDKEPNLPAEKLKPK